MEARTTVLKICSSHGLAAVEGGRFWLIELGFKDTSTILCCLPEKRREIEEMKERDRGEREINESEETEEIKTFPLYPYLLQG